MKQLILIRLPEHPDGTFGVLLDDGTPFCVTLERPWKDNIPNESCIPVGNYICRRVNSPKFGNTFEVTGVVGRIGILFHKGNIDDDTHGCILVGEQYERLGDHVAILASGKAFQEFIDRTMGMDMFKLKIVGLGMTDD